MRLVLYFKFCSFYLVVTVNQLHIRDFAEKDVKIIQDRYHSSDLTSLKYKFSAISVGETFQQNQKLSRKTIAIQIE